MQRRATGLLVFVTGCFLAVTVLGDGTGWTGYAQAAAEGSMVGGLADWFAVTALFRHPLGIPIPHTAIIRERKDQFGATLGSFVQENFLSPEVLTERIRASGLASRAGEWLAVPDNASRVAGVVADVLVAGADGLRDEDVHRVFEEELTRAVDAVPLAPLAGRAVRLATAEGRHQDVLDALLRGLERYLDENETDLRARLDQRSPWWLPGAVEDRIYDRLIEGVHRLVHAVNEDPDHELRRLFDERVAVFAHRLCHDPVYLARGEELKREALANPELRAWSSGLWSDVKVRLRAQAEEPSSPLRTRLAEAVILVGERLGTDAALRDKVEGFAESAAAHLTERYQAQISELVSGTIARWDARETSRKLELLLGRDLQFIRINGTVVGGVAGLAIHAVSEALA